MGGLNVIMTWDFYQVLSIWDFWNFQSQINGLNSLGTIFWHEDIKHYELKQVMWQISLIF